MLFIGNQQYAHFKKFANDRLSIPLNGLLRKLASIFLDFIGCKDTHFSQMSLPFSCGSHVLIHVLMDCINKSKSESLYQKHNRLLADVLSFKGI